MKTIRVNIDPDNPESLPEGRVDFNRLDATTERDIAKQQQRDETDSMLVAAKFARRVRKRLGLSQADFLNELMCCSTLSVIGNKENVARQVPQKHY